MNKTMQTGARILVLAAAASAALVACGGGDDNSAPTTGSGTLRVALTDAPACGLDQVVVTVEKVRAHQSAGAGENDAGWHDIVLNPAKKVDLLSLQNGILVDLGQTTLPAGQYTQMRLVLSSNSSGTTANYVMPSGGPGMTPMAMDTPSAQQSGIKLVHPFTIEAGKTTGLVLDFDACKSVVRRGNGSYGLKPVIGVVPLTLTKIVGYVQTSATGVTVSAQKDGVVYKATQPVAASGYFELGPIDPRNVSYDVVFTGAGKTTSVVTGVTVTADQPTTINSTSSAIDVPVAATSSLVSGDVLPNLAWPSAWVRALQSVNGKTVEVAYTRVNEANGTYSLSLPTVAARYVVYTAPFATSPTFLSDSVVGQYTLEASATGYQKQPKVLAQLTGTNPLADQDFSLSPAP